MYCPLTDNISTIFKSLEWFFVAIVILTALHLLFGRFFFTQMVKLANWAIRYHGFDGQVIPTEKAFGIFRRDLWFLLGLNILVVVLIRILP